MASLRAVLTGEGVTVIETVGLGGVGKTQVAIEFCHRSYRPADDSGYGLVIWLNSESSESIAAGLRDLAADSGIVVRDMHNEAIVAEVRARLYRTNCRWLLVFDNAESYADVACFLPRGGSAIGHVLITSRRMFTQVSPEHRVSLDCFSPEEAIEFLTRAAGPHVNELAVDGSDRPVGLLLAELLGCLPLALSLGSAYMNHCDVSCKEYYRQLQSTGRFAGGESAVRESLQLSLERMDKEDCSAGSNKVQARSVLDCFAFLAPDGISRAMVAMLIKRLLQTPITAPSYTKRESHWALMLAVLFLFGALLVAMSKRRRWLGVASALGCLVLVKTRRGASVRAEQAPESPTQQSVAESVDLIWMLLKDFSLLSVEDRNGSVHRLLQHLLRELQPMNRSLRSLICCVKTLRSLWSFDGADVGTWAPAGKLLEHVKTTGMHVHNFLKEHSCNPALQQLALDAADLLTEAALYMSMALSRFDEADVTLEIVTSIHAVFPTDAVAASSRSRALLTRGKVSRYRGRLEESQQYLQHALGLWRGLAKGCERHLWGVAAVLHELGVLHLKRVRLPEAEKLLHESLKMKRMLKSRQIVPVETRMQRFSDEAATLHQLAVAAMLVRPARLSQAEELLHEALALETTDNPFGSGARAASLQQLARVLIRRGQNQEARTHLHEALQLYTTAYGSSPHVNVIAVKTQLGKAACSLAAYGEASGHFLDVLAMQQQVYGPNHSEIASTLNHLGAMERARKDLPAARRYFEQQRQMLTRLLWANHELQFQEGSALPRAAEIDASCEQLLRQLQIVLGCERTVAKDLNETERVKSCGLSLKELSKMLREGQNRTEERSHQTGAAAVRECALCHACIGARQKVREALLLAKKSKIVVDRSVIEAAEKQISEALRAHRADDSDVQGASHQIYGLIQVLEAAATEFCDALQGPQQDLILLFGACDAMRGKLHKLSITVT